MTREAEEQNKKLKDKIALQQSFVDLSEEPEKKKKTAKASATPKEEKVDQTLKIVQAGTDAAARLAFDVSIAETP